MNTNIRAGSGARASDRADSWTMLEEDDEILRRIEREILDPHPQIVHDEPLLAHVAARQPRGDEHARRAELLERFGE